MSVPTANSVALTPLAKTPNLFTAPVDQLLTVETDQGVLIKICLGVALFFTGSQQDEKRQAVLDILADYRDLVGDQLTWTINRTTGKWKKLKGFDSYITPMEWLPTHGRGEWEFVYHGGQRRSDADAYGMVVLGKGQDERISRLYCQFPIDFFIEREEQLPALVQRWCEKLKPEHGFAGFWKGQLYGYTRDNEDKVKFLEYKFGRRFPGLQIRGAGVSASQFFSHSLNPGRPNADAWLTILSDAWLEKLGGVEHVKEQMGELPVLEFSGGAILCSGTKPQLGDNEDPRLNPASDDYRRYQAGTLHTFNPYLSAAFDDYRRVAEIIEPVKAKGYLEKKGIDWEVFANNFGRVAKQLGQR
ncbi:hypothetical protein EHLJMEHL_01858 [Vreelandella titanicae]